MKNLKGYKITESLEGGGWKEDLRKWRMRRRAAAGDDENGGDMPGTIVQRSHLAPGTFAYQNLDKYLQSTCEVQSRSPKMSTAAQALKKLCTTRSCLRFFRARCIFLSMAL